MSDPGVSEAPSHPEINREQMKLGRAAYERGVPFDEFIERALQADDPSMLWGYIGGIIETLRRIEVRHD